MKFAIVLYNSIVANFNLLQSKQTEIAVKKKSWNVNFSFQLKYFFLDNPQTRTN